LSTFLLSVKSSFDVSMFLSASEGCEAAFPICRK
jgi:hypothetical protein